ncbi:MAG: O-antigen ligase family protein, partial [Dehalococcoidia bacterium]
VTITLGNSTFVGGYTLVNVFIGLALLAHSFSVQTSKNTRYIVLLRLYWLLAVAMNCWMLFLSGTRGALIGLVAGGIVLLVCYVVLERSRRLKVALLGLTALLVIAPSALFLVGQTTTMDRITFSNVLTQRAARTALAEGSVRNRLACFTAGVEGFVARPILGWGPENFVVAFGRYFNGDPKVTGICDQAHNKLVEELATRGIVGFLSYSAIWAAMFLVLIRTLRRQREGPWRFTVFIAGALVGYFVHNLFLFDTPATFLQLVLLLAFVVSLEMAHRASGGQEDSNASPVAGCSCTGKSRIPGWAQKAINCVIFGPRWRTAFMMVAVMGLVASSIYFLNYRPYRAATATAGVIDPSITWSQRLDKFDQSVNLFPHLANNPRQILFTMLASNWTLLPEREAERALAMVEIESRRALDAEPQGWQIHAALARFYQSVSIENPARNLDLARSYADGANQLAPKTYLVSRVLARQQSVELNQGMVVADPQGPFSAVLVVPVFLLIGVDELIYAWPRISDKQAAGVR